MIVKSLAFAQNEEKKLSQNPYSSPINSQQPPYQSPSGPYGNDPANQLKLPAIFLIIFASISILNILAGPFVRVAMGQFAANSPQFYGSLIVAILISALQGVTLMAGVNMLRTKQYSFCRTGAIIACIPVCTPCLVIGIPFAIWSIVLLGKPEIKNSFQS